MASLPHKRLAVRLNLMHVPAPITEKLWEMLELLYTEEEAHLAACLPATPKEAPWIARKAGLDEGKASRMLEDMADRGLLMCFPGAEPKAYCLLPLAPGLVEFQLLHGREDERTRRFAEFFRDYYDTEGGELLAKNMAIPFGRVLPLMKAVEPTSQIHPFEQAAEFIDQHESFAVVTCYCRHEKHLTTGACDRPRRNCMAFGKGAEIVIERNMGRRMDRKGMLTLLEEAEDAGCVHVSDNTQGRPSFLCNCCPCCCGLMRAVTELGGPAPFASSSWIAVTESGNCKGCGLCVAACPTKALYVEGKKVRLMEDLCIGCGVCVAKCKRSAIRLDDRPFYEPPAETFGHMVAEMGLARFGVRPPLARRLGLGGPIIRKMNELMEE